MRFNISSLSFLTEIAKWHKKRIKSTEKPVLAKIMADLARKKAKKRKKICRFWQKVAKIFANMALLLYLCQINKHKTTKINDQRMKINDVIERHGMQLRDVSREMGMKPSALQSAIDRNLTVKTLRQISEAARIPIAEFFMDELTDGERQQLLAAMQRPSPDPSLLGRGVDTAEQQAIEQPKENEQPSSALTADVAFICPHCHEAIKLGFVK